MANTKQSKSYRQLSLELETILMNLQHEDIDIDEALQAYDKGLALVKELEAYLEAAENKVRELKAKRSGLQ